MASKKPVFDEPHDNGVEIGAESDQDASAAQESSIDEFGDDWQAEQAALEKRLTEIKRAHGLLDTPRQVVTIVPLTFGVYSGEVLTAAMAGYNQALAQGGNEAQAVIDGISAAKLFKSKHNLR